MKTAVMMVGCLAAMKAEIWVVKTAVVGCLIGLQNTRFFHGCEY